MYATVTCYCYCSHCLYLHLFPVCIASLLFSYSANSRKCAIKLSVSVFIRLKWIYPVSVGIQCSMCRNKFLKLWDYTFCIIFLQFWRGMPAFCYLAHGHAHLLTSTLVHYPRCSTVTKQTSPIACQVNRYVATTLGPLARSFFKDVFFSRLWRLCATQIYVSLTYLLT